MPPLLSNRLRIVLVAVGFNLLFEYSLRGFNNVALIPALAFVLPLTYFSLFMMVEDLILRYRLQDRHLVLLAMGYATAYDWLTSGILVARPGDFAIDWGAFLFIGLVWWAALQAVLTFYLANRLTPRDWNRPRLTSGGWVAMILLNTAMVLLFQLNPNLPRASVPEALALLGIILAFFALCARFLPRPAMRVQIPVFRRSRVLDLLAASTVVVFFVSATFLSDTRFVGTSLINASSLALIIPWTLFVAVVLLAYRLKTRTPIPV